jgi:hypothetical protein
LEFWSMHEGGFGLAGEARQPAIENTQQVLGMGLQGLEVDRQ